VTTQSLSVNSTFGAASEKAYFAFKEKPFCGAVHFASRLLEGPVLQKRQNDIGVRVVFHFTVRGELTQGMREAASLSQGSGICGLNEKFFHAALRCVPLQRATLHVTVKSTGLKFWDR
jgi:hypothetical protein